MKYHLVRLYSEIEEDDYQNGLGDSTGCGLSGEHIGKTFEKLPDAYAYLASTWGLPDAPDAYECDKDQNSIYTSHMVADHSNAQNGGWFEPTEAEKAAWVKGKQKLYSETFTITFVRCL